MNDIEAIRDFFLAGDAGKLKRSYQQLSGSFEATPPVVEDWQEVEFAFNRLFVGPAALEAPPFSSVYLDAQGLVMGQTTMAVRQMYAALGLESPWKNSLPDDHISLELDAALAMNHVLKKLGHSEIQELHARFMNHMTRWVPLFADRVLTAPSRHPAINHVVLCLSDWLDKQTCGLKNYQSAREEKV
ncbi:molecular chaperone [Desulforhopalus sp. IMCC35007]|uniref:TorD/DmsD family molecular chaperone n=1 Tax=Desulforhopalus sp. IMCC35007 TaxID=2569543 RepID=UPI0010AE6BCB|nr:molecular chaperone TorD family protein [Desulforhopalus sp. IMCC35007]TKB10388.1 cytoplasmic chaperone TorD family protein [Desulforhopalus sp. IMCC35007]